MANYYDTLNLAPTATAAEIETAIEEQYNVTRRKVTHHDPDVVNKANQDLQVLETMRAVLTDPAKRSIYDAGIGASGSIGGLADPEAILRGGATLSPTPPPAHIAANSKSHEQVTDAWMCPKCQTSNAIGTKFCKRCGQALGRNCPNCDRLIEAIAPYCSECGANVESAARAKRAREEEAAHQRALQEQQSALQMQKAEQQRQVQRIKDGADKAWRYVKWGYFMIVSIFLAGWALFVLVAALAEARKTLQMSPVSGDDEFRKKAQKAYRWALVPLLIFAATLALAFISGLVVRR